MRSLHYPRNLDLILAILSLILNPQSRHYATLRAYTTYENTYFDEDVVLTLHGAQHSQLCTAHLFHR